MKKINTISILLVLSMPLSAGSQSSGFASFLEPDFPFVGTGLDLAKAPEGFPDELLIPRCLV
ncbi:MAG: hypothetical protein AAF492_24705, partial [Verrucomicrobiota bacterium]